ncbi:MAG: GNAT family N-acetyltransferase [Lachnospiraceae bacterium]|nr:GNAT family N-acetyltransferase [Lachnospiraceae bacterium]
MNIIYKTSKENVNWSEVDAVMRRARLADHTTEEVELIFRNSWAVVFVYDDDKLIGVCRALSDGVCQAAIYNVTVLQEYRGFGIGRAMMEQLMEQLKGQNIILYTHPRSVAMYEKFGFRRSKTAMVRYSEDTKSEADLAWREKEGFLLPEKYRFIDEYGRPDMQEHTRPVSDDSTDWMKEKED